MEDLDPQPEVFQKLVGKWCEDSSIRLVNLLWNAYDLLMRDFMKGLPITSDHEVVENTLNFYFAQCLDRCKDPDAPFCVQSEVPESTKRKRGRGKSPTPDFGFVFYGRPRSVWALEAKVLKDPSDVINYCKEVTGNFLSARYSTYSSEGAMIGYLLTGNPADAFDQIELTIPAILSINPLLPTREYRSSEHRRTPPNPFSPAEFVCHHLVLKVNP